MTQVLQPPGWARPKGYANGVAASGRQVFVAGMIGWDEQGQFHTDEMAGQVRQALHNVWRCWPRPVPGPSTSCA
jgi:enamine deaminase RidA (YjgF/YER057c/UK114 family)